MQRLTFKSMSKAYHGVPALVDVTLALRAGRVHALMGENGAGKSTLIKLIAGVVAADRLVVEIDDAVVPLASAQDAQAANFRFIHQELNIVPQVSVAENILLGRDLPRRFGGAIRWDLVRAQAQAALAMLGADHIDVRMLAGDLSAGDKMLVKIAAALVSDPKRDQRAVLYVLDEPTAALTAAESALLFDVIARLTATGAAVLYVSHRIDEVLRICDDITVLRDGRLVSSGPVAATSKDRIIHDMTGRDVQDAYPPRLSAPSRQVTAAVVKGATATLGDLNFEICAGEVLGIAGLAQAGQNTLLEMFIGLAPLVAGQGHFCQAPLAADPAQAWAKGIAYLPKERRSEGLMLDMSICANILAPHLGQYGFRAQKARERRDATAIGAKMRLKYDNIDQPVGQLSGGNQQKVLFARALHGQPKLILLNEPTRGVDVGAKYDIYQTVRSVTAQGAAVIMTSSDLPEMLGMCDRILVLQNGQQTALLDCAGLTSAALLTHFYPTDAKVRP
jgi:ribose transport system ATP-binding protein